MTTPTRLMPLDSTLALVTRAREGDQAAIEMIVGRYQAALTRFGHGRLPRAARGLVDTDDIVQVAVVRTLGRLKSFDPSFSGSLLAYLRRAVLNQIRDEIRRSQRRAISPKASASPVKARSTICSSLVAVSILSGLRGSSPASSCVLRPPLEASRPPV